MPAAHHDALEFPDGRTVLLTHLCEGQTATVLQLPAQPEVDLASGAAAGLLRNEARACAEKLVQAQPTMWMAHFGTILIPGVPA